jgi:RimJ/RimL family protein N-acetyltransferase
MDMRIFQVKSNKALPHTGSILIASPLLYDYHFARSALSLLERHCFSLLGMHQLYAYVKTSNAACINLFHSAGFNTTGVLKDWLHTGRGYRDVCLLQKMNPLIA